MAVIALWVILVAAAGFALHYLGSRFKRSSANLRIFHLKYQSATLALGLVLFVLSGLIGNWSRFFGDYAAPVTNLSFLGVTKSDTWVSFGPTMAVIMGGVTLIVVWIQAGKGKKPSLAAVAANLPVVVVVSLANSLTEELIFRVTLVQGLAGFNSAWLVALLSAIIFGGLHYFGQPGRIPGVLMAGFMGWLLTWSVIQTGGIFWAWLIHFIQDVIILTIVFAAGEATQHTSKVA